MATHVPPETKPAREGEVGIRQVLGRFAPLIAFTLVIGNAWWFSDRLAGSEISSQPSAAPPTAGPIPAGETPVSRSTSPQSSQAPTGVRPQVPALLGLPVSAARRVLSRAGLQLGRREWVVSGAERNAILASSPAEGTTVTPRARVDLTVSAGPLQSLPVVEVNLEESPGGAAFNPVQITAEAGSLLVINNLTAGDCATDGDVPPPSQTSSNVVGAGLKGVFNLMVIADYRIACSPATNTVTIRVTG
jgi:hypothetical protein